MNVAAVGSLWSSMTKMTELDFEAALQLLLWFNVAHEFCGDL